MPRIDKLLDLIIMKNAQSLDCEPMSVPTLETPDGTLRIGSTNIQPRMLEVIAEEVIPPELVREWEQRGLVEFVYSYADRQFGLTFHKTKSGVKILAEPFVPPTIQGEATIRSKVSTLLPEDSAPPPHEHNEKQITLDWSSWETEVSRMPRFAVLPVGSFEQHGPHLPLVTDTLIAKAISSRLAQKGGLLLPGLPYSCSHANASFFGTVSLRPETVLSILREIFSEVERHGISKLIIVNTNENNHAIRCFAQEKNIYGPIVFLAPTERHWLAAAMEAGIESGLDGCHHGGEIETSIVMSEYTDAVTGKIAIDTPPADLDAILLYGMSALSPRGSTGYPSLATHEKGSRLIEAIVNSIWSDISDLMQG